MHEEVSVFSYICVCGGCALNLYPVGPFVFVVNWCAYFGGHIFWAYILRAYDRG